MSESILNQHHEVALDMSGERCDPRYGPEWNASVQYHLARYRFACRRAKHARVLDVACGLGYGARMLAEAGAKSVLGLDLAKQAILAAQKRYGMSGLEFRVDDAQALTTLAEEDRFDLVVSFETIEHLPRPEELLKQVSKRMGAQAIFYVSTPWREGGRLEDKPANKYHVREWTLAEFASLVGGFFKHVEWFVQGLPFREQQHTPAEVGREAAKRVWCKLRGKGWPTTPYYDIIPVRAPASLQPTFCNPTFIIAVARL